MHGTRIAICFALVARCISSDAGVEDLAAAYDSEELSLTLDGLTLRHTLGADPAIATQAFCSELATDCVAPPCPAEDQCQRTLGGVLANLEALLVSNDPFPPTAGPASQEAQGGGGAAAAAAESAAGAEAAAAAEAEVAATEAAATEAAAVAAAAAASGEKDLVFEVIVSAEGGRARFTHAAGTAPEEGVAEFCAAHVDPADVGECTASLVEAVGRGVDSKRAAAAESAAARARWAAWGEPGSVFGAPGPSGGEPVGLQVQIAEGQPPQVFVHTPGSDPNAEAAAFCAKHFGGGSAVDAGACRDTLVGSLEEHLADLEKAKAAGAAGAAGAAAGVGGAGGGGGGGGTAVARLLGPSLVKGGPSAPAGGAPVATAEALKGAKVVGLYFAADWCPPCRQFTPLLAKYHSLVRNFKRKGFEVVWVSASRDAQGYNGYLQQMPWPALPFEQRQAVDALRQRYGVKSFPTLIFVDAASGEVLTAEARDLVMRDPNGDGFPYAPPGLALKRLVKGLYTQAVPAALRAGLEGRLVAVRNFIMA